MALSDEDIELHRRLIRYYERQASKSGLVAKYADLRRRRYERAIENEKAFLQAEGVEV